MESKSKVNGWIIVIGGLFFAMLVFALIVVGMIASYNNKAVRAESTISAFHTDSENVLGQLAPKLKETLGVTDLQSDALVKVIQASNESRYGKNGSSATVQFIKEQNPNLDQANFNKAVEMIESGRNDFSKAQSKKIDAIRNYHVMVESFPGKLFYSFLGYPTPGFFDKYEKIVVSSHAKDAFDSGIDDGIKLK